MESQNSDARRRKKLALFVSASNPVFEAAQAIEKDVGLAFAALRRLATDPDPADVGGQGNEQDTPSTRHAVIGVSHETLRKWSRLDLAGSARDREAIAKFHHATIAIGDLLAGLRSPSALATAWLSGVPAPAREAAAGRARALGAVLAKFRADYEDTAQATPVYETGDILGIPLAATQLAVDAAIYAERPLLRHAYFDRAEANTQFAGIGGLYRAWVRRRYGEMRTWMRCSVHVRYVLEVGGRHTIRVKLNLPVLFPRALTDLDAPVGHTYFEYDGFLDIKDQNVFWFLEKRDDFRTDYFTAITSRRKPLHTTSGVSVGLVGRYLTAHQDSEQSVVSGPIVLELVARAPATYALTPDLPQFDVYSEKRLKAFMWDEPLKLEAEDAECARLDALVDKLGLG